MGRPLREWVDEYCTLGADAFAAAHPYPFLFELEKVGKAGPAREDLGFQTIRMSKTERVLAKPLEMMVFPVRKNEERNAFGMMITVGRALNNDVVLESAGISKFHAHFEQRDGRWCVCDAGSSNGTSVDDTLLEARRPFYLRDGAVLRFAKIVCRFQEPAGALAVFGIEAKRRGG